MFPRWLGPLVGTLMGLTAVAAIVWMAGVKAQIWPSPPGGFWIF